MSDVLKLKRYGWRERWSGDCFISYIGEAENGVFCLAADADLAIQQAGERERKIIQDAVRLAGKELAGEPLSDEKVRAVADMFIREERCVSWHTFDEREAARLDLALANDKINEQARKIEELEDMLYQKGEQDA